MKPFLPVSTLLLVFGLSLTASVFAGEKTADKDCDCCEASPASSTFAARGGKASGQHARAKAAKDEADEAAAEKVRAKTEAARTGVKPLAGESEDKEKGWVWTHRAVRHKQTMPAAPKLDETATK